MSARLPTVLFSIALSACGSKKAQTAEECGPLSVTVDGTAQAAMPYGLAVAHVRGAERTWNVHVFNHDANKCEAMLSKSGRPIAKGEVSFRAFTGGEGLMGDGVGIDAHTQAGAGVSLIGEAPKKAGDKLSVCVPSIEFKPVAGDLKGKTVKAKGALTGTYCGELTW